MSSAFFCVFSTLAHTSLVVRLPRPIEGNGGTTIFRSFTELAVPLHAAGVVGTLDCDLYIYIYNSGILSTTVTLDIKDAIL